MGRPDPEAAGDARQCDPLRPLFAAKRRCTPRDENREHGREDADDARQQDQPVIVLFRDTGIDFEQLHSPEGDCIDRA
jgi:hypothetical protein